MSEQEFLYGGPYLSDLLISEEKSVLLNAINTKCVDQESYLFDAQDSENLFSENGRVNLDEVDLKEKQTLNHDLQWLLSETKMNVKRKYSRPTCLVAPNRININSNNHQLLDELNNDKNNNQQYGNHNQGTIKKKSRPKKLLNGIGDFIICFIQLLD